MVVEGEVERQKFKLKIQSLIIRTSRFHSLLFPALGIHPLHPCGFHFHQSSHEEIRLACGA